MVRDTGQLIGRGDTSLVSRRGQSRSPGAGPSIYDPSCKTRLACHEETLTGIAKRELVVYRVLRPYITIGLPQGKVRS